MRQYWEDCVNEAFEDARIEATKEQIDTVISWVEGAHENYSMASGDEVASRNFYEGQISEISKLKEELWKEKQKVVCPECHGSKTITTYGPIHCGTSECWKCRGAGRI